VSKSLKDKLLSLTSARYKHLVVAAENFRKSGEDPLGILLRVHLTSESILDELIGLVFEENAKAILCLGLTYRQKLDLLSQVQLDEGWLLIPDYIVGSLRKLNKLRNQLAHQLNASISNEQVIELFMNVEQVYRNMNKDPIEWNLKRYAFFILGSMLPKYEEIG
jgi:hypothetical protein